MTTLQRLSSYAFRSDQLSLFRQLGEFKGQQVTGIRQQPEVLDTLRQAALLESLQYSNRLEGILVVGDGSAGNSCSLDRVRRLVQRDSQPDTEEERLIAGYREAMDLVIEPGEHLTLSVSLLHQLHRVLFAHTARGGGRWRITNKEIIERNNQGQKVGVLYRTLSPSAITAAVDELVVRYHLGLSQQVEPLVLVAAVVLDFLCIHPFSDGNGRIIWLLMAMMLARNGYQVAQLISLERVLVGREQLYKEALHDSVKGWHQGKHDPMPWINFFLTTLVQAYGELEDKIEALQRQGIHAPKSKLVRRAIEQSGRAFAIGDICLQIPTVSRELVKKVVQQMRSEGLLEPMGKGRGAQWQKC